MPLGYFPPRFKKLRELQAAHAAATTTGVAVFQPVSHLTALLQSLTLLRPLPPPFLTLPYALSLFRSLPHPTSTLAHNLLMRLLLSLNPPSPLVAIRLFSRLIRISLSPDAHSFPLVLSACSRLRLFPLGRALHALSLLFGFSSNLFVRNALISFYSSCTSLADAKNLFHENSLAVDLVSYNALINGYAKAGDLENARHLFDEMPQRDAISYGTMISGYSHAGHYSGALQLFDQMQADGYQPDNVALTLALSCCAQLGELGRGISIHNYIRSHRNELSVWLLTGLVDMYAKCGAIDIALDMFNASPLRNQFTWNAIIVGLAMHGFGKLSLVYFDKMRDAGVRPDGITLLGVLVACSHSGFVETGRILFGEMERVHGVRRELKHYGCMADLLCRAGMIEETMGMIGEMTVNGDAYVWGGVLAGCRAHCDKVEVAETAARKLLELNPGDAGVYSIMAGIYAEARRWDDVEKVRSVMDAVMVKKNMALSLVQA